MKDIEQISGGDDGLNKRGDNVNEGDDLMEERGRGSRGGIRGGTVAAAFVAAGLVLSPNGAQAGEPDCEQEEGCPTITRPVTTLVEDLGEETGEAQRVYQVRIPLTPAQRQRLSERRDRIRQQRKGDMTDAMQDALGAFSVEDEDGVAGGVLRINFEGMSEEGKSQLRDFLKELITDEELGDLLKAAYKGACKDCSTQMLEDLREFLKDDIRDGVLEALGERDDRRIRFGGEVGAYFRAVRAETGKTVLAIGLELGPSVMFNLSDKYNLSIFLRAIIQKDFLEKHEYRGVPQQGAVLGLGFDFGGEIAKKITESFSFGIRPSFEVIARILDDLEEEGKLVNNEGVKISKADRLGITLKLLLALNFWDNRFSIQMGPTMSVGRGPVNLYGVGGQIGVGGKFGGGRTNQQNTGLSNPPASGRTGVRGSR